MTFGILSDWPGTSSYHNDILKGIEGYGKTSGIDIVTLAVGWYGSDDPIEQGRRALYELLRGGSCSGFIVYTASVGSIVGADALFAELSRMARSPMVSLSVPLEGYPSVVVDNAPGFTDLCRHLIIGHGYRDVVFVSGRKDNYDARIRLQILANTLSEVGVTLGEDRIWYGDFTAQSGVEAVRHFIGERGMRPQAFICANDYAAIGAWEEARKYGLVLPWDMAVTGFDNIEIGRHAELPFTTVRQPFYRQGHAAARILHDAIAGREVPPLTALPSSLVLRGSCGCGPREVRRESPPSEDKTSTFLAHHERRLDAAFRRFVDDTPGDPLIRAWQAFINGTGSTDLREADINRFYDRLSEKFTGHPVPKEKCGELLNNLLRMQRILADYHKETEVFDRIINGSTLKTLLEGVENFTQRLIAAPDFRSRSGQLRDVFASLGIKNAWLNLYADPSRPFDMPMRSVFRMLDGELAAPEAEAFPPLQLIPKEDSPHSWRSLIAEALYEGSDQLGILAYDNLSWDSSTNEILRRRFCTALQAIDITRHQAEMNESLQKEIERRVESEAKLSALMEELKSLSIKDDLTGLFNRRGFLTLGERQIKHYLRERLDYLVLFADMDGLKTINDTWGHLEGDEAIRTIARILESSCRDADIVARLGGDEFTVLLGSAGPQHVELIKGRIEAALAAANAENKKDYRVGLSLGFVAASEYPSADLRELMDHADRNLYAMKKAKKQDFLKYFREGADGGANRPIH